MEQFTWIKQRFSNPLPGEDAHVLMSPMGRGKSSEALQKATHVKQSAVAVHIFDAQAPKILLMQRPAYAGTHGGQISFPGGKAESTDESLLHTAQRESREEVGILETAGELIGRLTDIYIPVSKFSVASYVLLHLESNPKLKLEAEEVESTFFLPLKNLLDDKLIHHVDITLQNGHLLPQIPAFVYRGKVIWGATAIILNELKVLLRGH